MAYRRRNPCKDPDHMSMPCICELCGEWVELNDMVQEEDDDPMICANDENS